MALQETCAGFSMSDARPSVRLPGPADLVGQFDRHQFPQAPPRRPVRVPTSAFAQHVFSSASLPRLQPLSPHCRREAAMSNIASGSRSAYSRNLSPGQLPGLSQMHSNRHDNYEYGGSSRSIYGRSRASTARPEGFACLPPTDHAQDDAYIDLFSSAQSSMDLSQLAQRTSPDEAEVDDRAGSGAGQNRRGAVDKVIVPAAEVSEGANESNRSRSLKSDNSDKMKRQESSKKSDEILTAGELSFVSAASDHEEV